MDWFLINVITPLVLPIFLIAIIGLLCDLKPDALIKIYIEIVQNAVLAILRCVLEVAKICFNSLLRFFKCLVQCLLCAAQAKCDAASRCKPGPSDNTTDPGDDEKAPPKKRAPRKPKQQRLGS